MRIVIFGATGKVGTHLVDQALRTGFDVTAVVRDPSRLAPPSRGEPRVVTADVMAPTSIEGALIGSDAVLTALGSRGLGPTTILAQSARSITAAMEGVGVRRLLTVSGSMVDDTDDGLLLKYVGKPITRRILKNVCTDMLDAEEVVHSSHLDWTIFRPPTLAGGAATGRFRLAVDRNVPRGYWVRRADLAGAMLQAIGDAATIHHHVFIAR